MVVVVRLIKKLIVLTFFILLSGSLAAEPKPLKMGVMSLSPPAKTYKQWLPFADYLSNKLAQEIEIVVPRGFKKIKQAVTNKDVDFVFINSHVFYRLKQEGAVVGLSQMQNLKGSILSHSVLFVRSDSGINTLKDLKNKKVAFVSPMGAGGYLAPRAAFSKEGIKTQVDTKEEFTKNISTSIHKVLLGSVKAGTMCGLNYKLMSKRVDTGDLKIISRTDSYPEAVFAARSGLSKSLRNKISMEMINMYEDEKGKAVLKKLKELKIKKFIKYDSQSERITERLLKQGEFK